MHIITICVCNAIVNTISLVLSAIGTAQEFKRRFENPILRGRDAAATDDEHRKGEQKLQEVNLSLKSGQVLLFFLSLPL